MTNNESDSNSSFECMNHTIHRFPRDFMSNNFREHGGIVIHIVIAIYSLIGIVIVCREFFVFSLDRIAKGDSL
jgi:solute carrier family 24 (sodium/potassium/calcium exchanger), member 4